MNTARLNFLFRIHPGLPKSIIRDKNVLYPTCMDTLMYQNSAKTTIFLKVVTYTNLDFSLPGYDYVIYPKYLRGRIFEFNDTLNILLKIKEVEDFRYKQCFSWTPEKRNDR